ncbi:NAD(P)H-binding protein [Archangium violaceum]|uniref:NAD(P)H-binding protein n=1 Tax=Archangium violaceum TaxID=83451 RepID=UPI00195175A8|nr:NAD(P)H-binding protein [Archangium violaceum]QRN97979.1 NAD(P)H-binding protein [Archangium violaceum]
MSAQSHPRTLLVTGATGFVGRALFRALLREPCNRVRLLSRRPMDGAGVTPRVEVVRGDVRHPGTSARALRGVDTAYYLIHSLAEPGFREKELAAARTFARAAEAADVRQLIYLGALGDPSMPRSPHVESRQATGEALREGRVPVTELRAAAIIGAGSAVFEMIRGFTERFPLIISPRGGDTRCQPIALSDALRYLLAPLDTPLLVGHIWEMGGDEVLTYREMMETYAQVRGLVRPVLRMPVAVPRLSGLWTGLFSPIPKRVGEHFVRGLGHDAVVRDPRLRELLGIEHHLGFRDALRCAFQEADEAMQASHVPVGGL